MRGPLKKGLMAMSLLLTATKLTKTVGAKTLFEDLSFGLYEREKVGLIGPNGAGKSTLLKILSGEDDLDSGEISKQKSLTVSMVEQNTHFSDDISAHNFILNYLIDSGKEALEAEVQATIALSLVGVSESKRLVSDFSGGWKKRIAIARALALDPDLLILDEPTNHMDWDGIFWLEGFLKTYKKSFILVSHDRVFLDNVTNRTIEINPLYRDGYLSFNYGYKKFLQEKESYIQSQLQLEETLSNKARREVEWLRAGVKARTTKSQSRINEAYDLLENLDQVKERNLSANKKTRLEIDATERKTKKLLELKNLTVGYPDKVLVKDLDMILGPKKCLGLLGDNGTGKTSLLKAITSDELILQGSIFRAEDLKIVYFDQKRDSLPQDVNLMHYLGDGGDYVVFKNQSVHVASYASRFLFSSDKMQLKISQLSGGEQARVLIAKLLLQPSDVLILDEPTNDLDIETIEILEETLLAFEGLVILVSHDREFMSNLASQFLGLWGDGTWATYASVDQWLSQKSKTKNSEETKVEKSEIKTAKVKMSYKEKQQLQTIEDDIAKAEEDLDQATQQLNDPNVLSDRNKLQETSQKVQTLQNEVDRLYELWQTLEEKQRLSK